MIWLMSWWDDCYSALSTSKKFLYFKWSFLSMLTRLSFVILMLSVSQDLKITQSSSILIWNVSSFVNYFRENIVTFNCYSNSKFHMSFLLQMLILKSHKTDQSNRTWLFLEFWSTARKRCVKSKMWLKWSVIDNLKW